MYVLSKLSLILLACLSSFQHIEAKEPMNTYLFLLMEEGKEPKRFGYTKATSIIELGKILDWSCRGAIEVTPEKIHVISVVCGKRLDVVMSSLRCENKVGSSQTAELSIVNPKTQNPHRIVTQCNVKKQL